VRHSSWRFGGHELVGVSCAKRDVGNGNPRTDLDHEEWSSPFKESRERDGQYAYSGDMRILHKHHSSHAQFSKL
jgi:hypothetical protein